MSDSDPVIAMTDTDPTKSKKAASKSGGTLGGFVWKHSSDGSPEHTRGSLEMSETTSWVGVDLLVQEFVPLELVSEK